MTTDQVSLVLVAALAVSEALSLIPTVKANGIFQAISNTIKAIASVKEK